VVREKVELSLFLCKKQLSVWVANSPKLHQS
jgi:hypothetical protein